VTFKNIFVIESFSHEPSEIFVIELFFLEICSKMLIHPVMKQVKCL